jgi:hypothetical protein
MTFFCSACTSSSVQSSGPSALHNSTTAALDTVKSGQFSARHFQRIDRETHAARRIQIVNVGQFFQRSCKIASVVITRLFGCDRDAGWEKAEQTRLTNQGTPRATVSNVDSRTGDWSR